ncbi:hypothetical protein GOC53_28000 [Sinorhizobium medicae]|nr:hypothetical protein [Sinorhizobium medicae]
MLAAGNSIERFPTWAVRAQHQLAPRADWIRIGYEHDLRRMVDLWQRYLFRQITARLDLLALPDDNGVMWQLYRRLVGNALRQPLVLVRDGVVSVDKRHLSALREGFDLLAEFLEDDHHPDLHVWDSVAREYVRQSDAPPPAVDREETSSMYRVIDDIRKLSANNVVKLWEDALPTRGSKIIGAGAVVM